jgi:hypothetical protein
VSIVHYHAGGADMYYARTKGGWKGTINSNKGEIECALVDTNRNGRYDDLTGAKDDVDFVYERGDQFFADTNGHGKVMTQGWGPHAIALCEVTKIGAKFYNIKPSPSGGRVSIEPYDGPFAELKVKVDEVEGMPGVVESIYVVGVSKYYSLELSEGPAEIPE